MMNEAKMNELTQAEDMVSASQSSKGKGWPCRCQTKKRAASRVVLPSEAIITDVESSGQLRSAQLAGSFVRS